MTEPDASNRYDSVLDLGGCRIDGATNLMVRMIQQSRGGEPCFATDKRYDCAEGCEWRRDCRKLVAAWLRY